MKWKLLLLTLSFLGRKSTIATAAESSCPAEPVINVEEQLNKLGINLDKIVLPSSKLIKLPPDEVKKQTNTTKTYLKKLLRNPESLCKFTTSLSSLASSTNDIEPLNILVVKKEELRSNSDANFMFKNSKKPWMAISTHDLSTLLDSLQHELHHLFISTHNLALSGSPSNDKQKLLRLNNGLTNLEETFAPYNHENKEKFENILAKGYERLNKLIELIKKSLDITTQSKLTEEEWQLIRCLRKEAENLTIAKKYHQKNGNPLQHLISKVYAHLYTAKMSYVTPESKHLLLFEEDAHAHGTLTDSPRLFNYLYPELRKWHAKRIPAYKKCLDELAPERHSLSCTNTR